MNIEIHTVSFEFDVRLLELQLLSIDKMFEHDVLNSLVITLNGKDNDSLAERVKEFLNEEVSHALAKKVRIARANDFITASADGWKDQQYLKLYTVAGSNADWVIVLDSKNHFIKKTNCSDFFDGGRAKTFFGAPSGQLQAWLTASKGVYGVDVDDCRAMPTVTPYLMRPDLVRLMLGSLSVDRDIHNRDNIFESPKLAGVSEFFLYYAFLERVSCIDLYYVAADRLCETLYTVWPQNHEIVERYLRELKAGKFHMFGLHRKRLPQLSEVEKSMIEELWAPLQLRRRAAYYLTFNG
jgi:hypothetical protein